MSPFLRPIVDWFSSARDRNVGDLTAHWHGAGKDAIGVPVRPLAIGASHATIQFFADESLAECGELELTCGDPSIHVSIPARICMRHASPTPGRSESTVTFDRTMEPELVQRFAVAGLIERRSYPRLPISLACEARPIDGPERPLHVRVLDYSASGVRAISAEPLPVGTQIFLCMAGDFPPGASSVTLRVVRNAPHEGENLLGCVFDGRSGYFRFKALVASDDQPAEPSLARDWSLVGARTR